MKCSKTRTFLADYLNGNLAPTVKEQINEHLIACDDCAKELAFLKTYLPAVKTVTKIDAPREFEAKLRDKILNVSQSIRPSWKTPVFQMVSATLTGVLALFLIVYIYQPLKLGNPSLGKEESTISKVSNETSSYKEMAPLLKDKSVPQAVPGDDSKDSDGKINANILLTLILKQTNTEMEKQALRRSESLSLKKASESSMQDTAGSPGAPAAESPDHNDVSGALIDPISSISVVVKNLGGEILDTKEITEPDFSRANGSSNSTASSGDNGPRQYATIRLPSSRYQEFLTYLGEVGELVHSNMREPRAVGAIMEVRLEIVKK